MPVDAEALLVEFGWAHELEFSWFCDSVASAMRELSMSAEDLRRVLTYHAQCKQGDLPRCTTMHLFMVGGRRGKQQREWMLRALGRGDVVSIRRGRGGGVKMDGGLAS